MGMCKTNNASRPVKPSKIAARAAAFVLYLTARGVDAETDYTGETVLIAVGDDDAAWCLFFDPSDKIWRLSNRKETTDTTIPSYVLSAVQSVLSSRPCCSHERKATAVLFVRLLDGEPCDFLESFPRLVARIPSALLDLDVLLKELGTLDSTVSRVVR